MLLAASTLKSYCTSIKSSAHHAVVSVGKYSNSTNLKLHKTLSIDYFVENCSENAEKSQAYLLLLQRSIRTWHVRAISYEI
jgi:hypothetical protein